MTAFLVEKKMKLYQCPLMTKISQWNWKVQLAKMRDRGSAKVISQDYNSKENIDIEA
jgi:hypothetical protein